MEAATAPPAPTARTVLKATAAHVPGTTALTATPERAAVVTADLTALLAAVTSMGIALGVVAIPVVTVRVAAATLVGLVAEDAATAAAAAVAAVITVEAAAAATAAEAVMAAEVVATAEVGTAKHSRTGPSIGGLNVRRAHSP